MKICKFLFYFNWTAGTKKQIILGKELYLVYITSKRAVHMQYHDQN